MYLIRDQIPCECSPYPRPIIRPTYNRTIIVESKATQTSPELMAHLTSDEQQPTTTGPHIMINKQSITSEEHLIDSDEVSQVQ